MKTNSVFELLKAKGVRVEPKPDTETKTDEPAQALKPKRTRLYHFDQPSVAEPTSEGIKTLKSDPVSNPVPQQLKSTTELGSNNGAETLITQTNSLEESKLSSVIEEQLGSKALLIREQLDSNKGAIEGQLGSVPAPQFNQLGSNKGATKGAIREQLGSKTHAFYELTGKEREFIIFVFKKLVLTGGEKTFPVSTEELRLNFSLSSTRLTNIVKRLVAKGVIQTLKAQRGKGGWRVFCLPPKIYQEVRQEIGFQDPIREQLGSDKGATKGATKGADSSCSSSILNSSLENLNTTTSNPDSWLNVPEILGKVPVRQLREASKEGGMSHEDLQQSLDHFGYDMVNGRVNSRTTNKIAILVGSLKKGGYFSQECQNELEQALNQVQKRRESIKQNEANAETARLKLEFDEWTKTNPEEFEKLKNGNPFLKNFQSPKMIESIVFPKWLETVKLKDPNDIGL